MMFAKDLKYEGSKVPVEETSIGVYGVAYVILVSAQLKSLFKICICRLTNYIT